MELKHDGVMRFEADGFCVESWTLALEVDDETCPFETGRVEIEDSQPPAITSAFLRQNVVWRVVVDEKDGDIIIRSSIENRGAKAVKLGQATLLQTATPALGVRGDDLVVLPWKVGQHLQEVYRFGDKATPPLSKLKVQFYNRTAQRALQIGFLTFQRANTEVAFVATESGLQSLRAYCDFAGWELAPGATTETEVFRLAIGDDPYQQMETWAQQAGALIGANIWGDAPIGYLGWSWVDPIHGKTNYEEVTLDTLDAINTRLEGFGVNYLWTSMSNIDGSLPGNWLKWGARCIPSGRAAFIKSVQDKGFHQGFWVGPLYICSSLTELMEEFRDAILLNPKGERMIVCDKWNHGDAGLLAPNDRPCLYALDPSHPKVLDFVRNIFEVYREWGVRYYMVDFLEAGAGNAHNFPYKTHHDQSLVAGPEAYLKLMQTMKSAGGEDTYFLASTGPTMINAGVMDGVRVGNDFGEGRSLSPEAGFYPATYAINRLDTWTGPTEALANHAANYHTHRRLYLNDSANVLSVDQPIPLSHARMAATVHAFSGGGTMLGDDIRVMNEDRLSLIKKTLPRSRVIAKPLDLFDAPHPASAKMFHRKVETPWQQFDVIALYNVQSEPILHQLELRRLGLDADVDYLVWDFWNEAFLGVVKGTLRVWGEAEAVRVVRFTRHENRPTLLGTDMHILMGEMEIKNASYDAETMTFSLMAQRPSGERGTAFVYAPKGLYVKNFDGLHIAKDVRDSSLVIGVPMQFDASGSATREIQFGIIQKK